MDILVWLTGKKALKIASAGSLTYFVPEKAPAGSTDRCLDCPVANQCRFDAKKAYLPAIGGWPSTVLTQDQTEEGILKALREGPYGRCVFRCDNNVCDHQTTLIEFEDGITAAFTLSGMTNQMHRTLHIMCEDGELWGDDLTGEIRISSFRPNNLAEYTGDSFRDLTRIARINEDMWPELFVLNKDFLIQDIDDFIRELETFREMIQKEDTEGMKQKMILSTERRQMFDGKEKK